MILKFISLIFSFSSDVTLKYFYCIKQIIIVSLHHFPITDKKHGTENENSLA